MTNRQLFLSHVAQTISTPLGLEINRAEDVYLYGPNEEKYIDMISGISVSSLGHCHPEVVKAVQDQAAKFMHLMVYGEYIYSPQVKLAEALNKLLPSSLDNFYFTNSGTEAVEGALKLSKRYTGRYEIISCQNAYHGSTAGSLSAMGSEEYKTSFRPLTPGHRLIRFNSLDDVEKITDKTAGVLIEVVQAEAGVVIGDKEFLKKIREKCTKTGTLLIIDEIQTGCGRTGKMFGFEHFDIVPDILLLGKALGGGMPIASFISSKEIMSKLTHNPILGHISTFGGNPVCCAAALATINVLKNSNLIESVEEKGQYIAEKLEFLHHTTISQIGLMIAIDFENSEKNFKIIEACIANGIITDWFLFNSQSMRICPPLTISYEEIDEFIEKFRQSYFSI